MAYYPPLSSNEAHQRELAAQRERYRQRDLEQAAWLEEQIRQHRLRGAGQGALAEQARYYALCQSSDLEEIRRRT